MPLNKNLTCAPWQPQAAKVLRAYLEAVSFGHSMREVDMTTGIDRNRLGRILNCRPGVNVNFWKHALINFIALAHLGEGCSVLPLLEEECRRMDWVKYSLTPEVKDKLAEKTR